jgi:dynamin-binding protein
MPDGDDGHDPLSSVQHSPRWPGQPSSHQSHRPSVNYLPLDRLSTLTIASHDGPFLSGASYHPQSSPSLEPQVTYTSDSLADKIRAEQTPSPDPSEFYRPYAINDAQKSPGLGSLLPSAEIGLGMTAITSAPRSPDFSKHFDPSYSRNRSTPRPYKLRSSSRDSSISSGDASLRPQPLSFIGARNRQASFKDLVERFNKNVDEVPPVPSALSSRATSPSPALNTRSRSGTETIEGHRRHADPSPPISFPPVPKYDQPQSPAYPNPHFSPSQKYSGQAITQRPLLGELLTIDTAVNNQLGHGALPPHIRRRGSESSIPSPHPFFIDNPRPEGLGPVISPTSPTAWYLGYTQSLESVNKSLPDNGGRNHRSRSDASWTTMKPIVASPLTAQMAGTSLQDPVSVTTPDNSHSSKSRIPVASRRASDCSSPSSPSTRTNSALGFHHSNNSNPTNQIPLAPKGSSRLPKPFTGVTSPERKAHAPPTIKSPGRRNVIHTHGSPRQMQDKGSLKVYVSAPPPKTSPPLRSSRPRQPVSAASTAASRAKVVDRVSRFQTSQSFDDRTRNPRTRTRKPPELGNVDFAARRQRIQQAFNKSVQETVKKEEEAAERRRLARYKRDEQVRSMLIREGELRKMASMESTATPVQQHANNIPEFAQPAELEQSTIASIPLVTPEDQLSTPTLSINTSNLHTQQSEAVISGGQVSGADSPTLGISTAPNFHPSSTSVDPSLEEIPPLSAVTAATNGSDSTNFDPEPQVGLDHHESHRNLLNRIMQLRESSSSDECDEDEDEEEEEDDDSDDNELCDEENEKESIRIMLDPSRSTFFLDEIDTSENKQLPVSQNAKSNAKSDTTNHEDPNRWSMASWASSTREQQSSSDSQCDAEDEPSLSIEQDSQQSSHLKPTADSPRRQSTYDYLHNKLTQSPGTHRRQRSHPDSLIRQGGWDSKRVTQLYLQELARGGFRQSFDRPWEIVHPGGASESQSKPDSIKDEPVMVPRIRDISSKSGLSHRASLSLRDDWENASPSIADWMQVAAEEEPSAPAPQNDAEPHNSSNDHRAQTSTTEASDPEPQLSHNSWDGLGLAIHVQSPVDETRMTPLPPMPTYSPPPAPKVTEALEAPFSQTPAPQSVSPSIYTSQPPSSNLSSSPFPALEEHQHIRHSEDSYLTQTGFAQSPATVASSATSQNHIPAPDPVGEVPAGSPTPEQKKLKQRRNVIKELVDTEYTYGRDMKVVDDIYKGTSSSCLDLSGDDVKILFANSDQIVQFSMNFQDALKHAAKSVYVMPKSQRWGSKQGNQSGRNNSPAETQNSTAELSSVEQDQLTFVGHVFMENIGHMEKVYTEYLKNHEAANKKLQVLQQNPKVEIWLKECRDWAADLTEAWNLDALLVKPVQRLVKYPLLLTQLINATPESHPDHAALVQALEGVTKISVRINDLKKRADVVGQVVSSRKRKDSDVRLGFSKAFGRRTEKLRQQVGLSEMFEDTEYNVLANRFNEHFFQLQVVMRDVEMYTREIKSNMDVFNNYVAAVHGCVDAAQSNYADIESKWNQLRVYVREIMNIALPEHIATVRKGVIDPMLTLLKLYEGPQKVMTKRDKRLLDYARYKSVKDRGDKPDKRTTEQGEQFSVLNDALKDELPRLFNLTANLMEACLKKFVSIQQEWYQILQQKLGPVLDRYPGDLPSIVDDWSTGFAFADAQIMSLALCNGALLSEAGNLVNFNAPAADGTTSPRRPSTVTTSSARTTSGTFESSPKVSYDPGTTATSIQSYGMDGPSDYHSVGSQSYVTAAGHARASSSISGAARTVASTGASTEAVNGQIGNGVVANALSPARPSTGSTGRRTDSFHTAPRLSLDMPFMQDSLLHDTNNLNSRTIESTASPARFSGFFSSAMPMSDSPMHEAPTAPAPAPTSNADPKVLFLAASLYEFNIDKSRREAGYPYLTYTEGEVFDVIGEKGELWLAKNQDDPSGQVGWIWTQHFAKLTG